MRVVLTSTALVLAFTANGAAFDASFLTRSGPSVATFMNNGERSISRWAAGPCRSASQRRPGRYFSRSRMAPSSEDTKKKSDVLEVIDWKISGEGQSGSEQGIGEQGNVDSSAPGNDAKVPRPPGAPPPPII